MSQKLNIPPNNKERIEWFYKAYGKKLCAYATRIYRVSPDAAQDILYKTIYKVAMSIDNYEFSVKEKLDGFVFRVFVNFLKNYLRDNKAQNETLYLEEIKEQISIQGKLTKTSEKLNFLNNELEKLEDWERILLLLRSQEMPYSEISKLIKKPEKHLKVYYGRLKQRLAAKLFEAFPNKMQNEK